MSLLRLAFVISFLCRAFLQSLKKELAWEFYIFLNWVIIYLLALNSFDAVTLRITLLLMLTFVLDGISALTCMQQDIFITGFPSWAQTTFGSALCL